MSPSLGLTYEGGQLDRPRPYNPCSALSCIYALRVCEWAPCLHIKGDESSKENGTVDWPCLPICLPV